MLGAGCHAGYGIDPADAIPDVTDPLAWPQAFAEAGATLIAGTGYQYGDTNYVAYSDQLYVDIAQQLGYAPPAGGSVTVGSALLDAEQQYLSSLDEINGLQEKALLQVTLYGLPMLGFDVHNPVAAPGQSSSVISGASGVSTAPGNQLGLESASYDLNSATGLDINGQTVTPTGSSTTYGYESGPQGVVADPGGPVLPVQTEDVNVSGETLRGVGFWSGTYTDSTAADPLLTGDPVTDTGNSSVVPFSSPVFLPQTMWNPNYFSTLLNNGDTDLSFNPVQYESTQGSSLPDQRTYSDLDVNLFYSNNTSTYGDDTPALSSPPGISNVTSTTNGDTVNVSANVTGDPAAGIQEVWVTYTGSGPGTPLAGQWQSVDLTQSSADSTLWTGSFTDGGSSDPAADSNFMVQAVNGVGQVTMDDNNGSYFTPTVTPGSLQTGNLNSYTLALGGDTSEAFSGTASLTATLTANAGDSGATIAGRSITFDLNGVSVTEPTGSNGVAQASLPLVANPGTYPLTATFAGGGQDAPVSAAGTFQVVQAPTNLVLSAPSPITLGADQATATLTSNGTPLPQKTVFFVLSSGATVVGTSTGITNSSGVAQSGAITVPPITTGSGYTMTAYFGSTAVPLLTGTYNAADPDYSGSTSSVGSLSIVQGSSNTALSGTGAVVTGQDLTFTASVTPGSPAVAVPTGGVEFFETPSGGLSPTPITGCTNVTLTAGQAMCPTSFTASGAPYSITASYSGDANYGTSSISGTERVSQASTNTALGGTGSLVSGQSATFTATVSVPSPGSGAPTGSVEFFETPSNGISVIPIGGCTSVMLTGGQAACPASFPASGSPYAITASYSGDNNYQGSSAMGSETVNQASTQTVLGGTGTVVSGQSTSLTATVSATGSGVGTPTGKVTFSATPTGGGATTAICTGVALNATGIATCPTTSFLASGSSYAITASYSGDSNFQGSSAMGSETVNQASTQTVLGGTGTVVSGQSTSLKATVSATGLGTGTPTGKVTFSATPTGGGPTTAICTGVALNAGVATCPTTSFIASGSTYGLTASYSGDPNYGGSQGLGTETVNKASTQTVLGGTGTVVSGQSTSLTATVSATGLGTGTPTGKVTFSATPTGGGATTAICTGVALNAAGIASCPTTSFLASGSTYALTATYSGDPNYGGSTGLGSETVNQASTQTVLGGTGSVVSGQSTSLTATVSATGLGTGTPTGKVTFSATPTGGGATTAICTGVALNAAGIAPCTTTSFLASGSTYALTATYSGDPNYKGSSGSGKETVGKSSSTTSLSAPSTSSFGSSIAVVATVAASGSGSGVPTGTVTLSDNGSVVGSASLAVSGGKDVAERDPQWAPARRQRHHGQLCGRYELHRQPRGRHGHRRVHEHRQRHLFGHAHRELRAVRADHRHGQGRGGGEGGGKRRRHRWIRPGPPLCVRGAQHHAVRRQRGWGRDHQRQHRLRRDRRNQLQGQLRPGTDQSELEHGRRRGGHLEDRGGPVRHQQHGLPPGAAERRLPPDRDRRQLDPRAAGLLRQRPGPDRRRSVEHGQLAIRAMLSDEVLT